LQPFRELGSEIHLYFRVLDLIFHSNDEEKRKRSYTHFYKDLVQRRTAMLEIADRIGAMNEQELTVGDAQIAATFDKFQLSLWATLAITLGGGLILAFITISYLLRLEGDARKHYLGIVRAQAELKGLSARLLQAQEEERRAISRELHDEVGQSLSALLMEAGNLSAVAPPGSAELQRHLDSIKRLAESSVTVIRNMMLLLRPSMLDDFGLVPALEWQARETAKRTGLRIHVDANETANDLPDEHKTCVYRIVQETLNNCSRHAQARSVDIAVRREPHKLVLTVQDDGNGFDPRRVRGLGLLGMEERVAHLNGNFEVRSEPGRGTLVQIELPLDPSNVPLTMSTAEAG
jgi:signal transduction histidine kinase